MPHLFEEDRLAQVTYVQDMEHSLIHIGKWPRLLTSTLQVCSVSQEHISKNLSVKYQQVSGTHTSNQCFWQQTSTEGENVFTEQSPTILPTMFFTAYYFNEQSQVSLHYWKALLQLKGKFPYNLATLNFR
jgi:CRISPR/Cas system-associated protein Cas5 (RAMP superfamily)